MCLKGRSTCHPRSEQLTGGRQAPSPGPIPALALLALEGRHSPLLGTSWAPEALPLLPEKWMCWSQLWSSLWPWTRTHGWYPASLLRSWGPGWAEPCCCLVSRSFPASGKRRCRDTALCLSTISMPFYTPQASPPHGSGGPACLGPVYLPPPGPLLTVL